MEINAANIAQHKSFVDKKMGEKRRFDELSTDEIQESVDGTVPIITKT